jgi:hypothetical protein
MADFQPKEVMKEVNGLLGLRRIEGDADQLGEVGVHGM